MSPATTTALLRPSSSRELHDRLFRMLQSCRTTNALRQLHAQLLLNGLSQKNYIIAKLLSACTATGDLARAALAFAHVADPTTTVFNQMIRALAAGPTPSSSSSSSSSSPIHLYNRMRRRGTAAPNGFTYTFLLTACARPQGEQLHAVVVTAGFGSNVFVQTNLVAMYAAADAVASAQRVFDEMPERNVVSWNAMLAGRLRSREVAAAFRLFDEMPERDAVSWTTMIAGCAQTGKSRQALALFREMRRARVCPDQVTMVAALSACADMGDLELGRWIHIRFQCQRLVSLDNALMNMYVKCGIVEEAERIFREMHHRSTVSWTTMIGGLAMHGRGSDALELFKAMQHEGVKPDGVTFIGILCACSHTGRVGDGRRYFEQMIGEYGIRPGVEHYGCMVDMLSRMGCLSEAREIIEAMPVPPNEAVWGALLNGCRMHRDVELASHAAEKLMELEADHAEGYLVLLSNAYSAAKRWEDVRRVRERMVQIGMSKPAGRSWVHVNGVLHDFVAGDQTHRRAPEIYKVVSEIAAGAKLSGHAVDTSQVLLDVEGEEEREGMLQMHSERLALAFALLSSRPGVMDPIRIMSNLRVCGDCHTTAKYVSEAFSREIIIRDQNRFHHFVGGACSCRDYW